jgi:hypothetical protein
MKMKKANKLEIFYNNKEFVYKVNNIDEAYNIVSGILNDPNIEMEELYDLSVLYNGRDDLIEMVE